MRKLSTASTSFTLTLAFLLTSIPLSAQGGRTAPSPSERRDQQRPVYYQLKQNPEFTSRLAHLGANPRDQARVDRYLRFLPLSPQDMMEIDMEDGRYEFVIPRFIHEWHGRWIELHETKARTLYGDAYVDRKLSKGFADPAGEETAGLETKATVGTNRNAAATFSVTPDDYQGEIQLKVNPNNPNQIVAAGNTFDNANNFCGGDTQAIWYSSDGGVTWGYTCAPDTTAYAGLTCNQFEFGSDPAVAWNAAGEVFLEYMLLCTPDGVNIDYSIVIARSTDGGAHWNGQGIVINSYANNNLEDKEFLAIDTNPGSPFNGRMYTCWDRNNNEKFAYSTNGGTSWTEVDLPNVAIDLGCDIAIEDNGTVHVVWDTLNCSFNCTNERMFYTRSTNGGVSWSSPVLVRDFNLVGFSNANCPDAQNQRCIGPFGTIAVDNTGGACDGTLYATFTDYLGGGEDVNDSDVWVARSTNGGNSWSAPVKVNDDGLANRAQFHPYMEVDPSNGGVVVGWHDARNDPGNDAIDYFVTRSLDCGLTFEPNIQVSQPSGEFNNSTISFSNENSVDNPGFNPNQYGEYMGVDALNNRAYLAWSDTRHFFPNFTTEVQEENLGFAIVDFDPVGGQVCGNNIIEGTEVCDGTDLGGETCESQGFPGGGTLTCDPSCTSFNTSQCDPGAVEAQLESGSVSVGAVAVTVNLANTYTSPVVVTTMQYSNSVAPTVTRVSGVTANSFNVRLQNPSGGDVAVENVTYLVVEEGAWTIDGVAIEAQKYTSTVTDQNNSWVGQAQSLATSFTNPVVIGQVMSENDPDWSVFWDQGTARTNPPTATTLVTGKTVCEDTDVTRADETVGFVVIEAGHGAIAGVEYEAALGADTVLGVGDSPPYTYTFNPAFATAPTLALASLAGMDGGNGGWAQIHGPTLATTTSLFLSVDEDTIGDPERNHTTEQVAYLAFAGPVVFPDPGGSTPVAEWGSVSAGGASARVNFTQTYVDPVVVATIQYSNNTTPVVTRVSGVSGTGFDLRLQNPSGGAVASENVSWLVVEAGNHNVGGVAISASKYNSTVTDENNSWVGQAQSYGQSFTEPVVLGQVMSENDADWSVFWDQGASRTSPPSATALTTGKTVCEDTDVTRAAETVGIIVIQAGHGSLGGVEFEAALGPDIVAGVTNAPPYNYTFNTAFADAPTVAVTTMAGVDGVNGGWAYVFGPTLATATTLPLAIDEDQIGDTERNHTTEQVGYVAFASPGSVSQ